MLAKTDLRRIASTRLGEAEALFNSRYYDGARYLCGYAIEVRLKYRICVVLKWSGYPSTGREFNKLKSFQTHNLDVLLHLSGKEGEIRNSPYFSDWSLVTQWGPDIRYYPIGSATRQDAAFIIASTRNLLSKL